MIGIIGAMSEETQILNSMMKDAQILEKAGISFAKGILKGKEVCIATCGIGKVNSALCTQIMIDLFEPDAIINVGVAGGLHPDIRPCDIVIATSLIHHDMDTTYFGGRLGQVPRIDTFDFPCNSGLIQLANTVSKKLAITSYMGTIVSGDQFISSNEKANFLRNTFNAYACEMEGAAIAQVCYLNKVNFVVIRAISDNANNEAHMDYETFLQHAVKSCVAIILAMVE